MSETPKRITQKNVGEVSKSAIDKGKAEVEKPFSCDFPGCNKTFKNRAGLASHQRSAHNEVKTVKEGKKKAISDTERVMTTKERLDKMPKILFIVPLEAGEKPGATIEVGINGYFMSYPKGKYFEAPQPVIDLIRNYIETVTSAGTEYKLDPNDPNDRGKFQGSLGR